MSQHIDPVCGKRMNPNKAHIVITYDGQDYYLCCPLCQKTFEENPSKFIKNEPKKRS